METTMEQHFISNTFWYDAETQDEMAKMLFSQVKMLRDQQLTDELERILLNVRLYGNSNIEGLKTFEYNRARDTNKISLNVIKQAVDTGQARIAKSKPRPMFLTEQGTYSNQRDAKKLQRFIDGIFYSNKSYSLGQDIFKDAGIAGKGFIKVIPSKGSVKHERVFNSELLVDQAECMYNDPSILYQIKTINKRTLKGIYPNKKKVIEETAPLENAFMGGVRLSDMIEIIEAWKLPSYEGAGDGLHIIAIEGGVLFKEEWDVDWFPFADYTWSKRVFGWYANGMADDLRGIQLEINKLLITIQRAMHLGSVPKIFVDANTKIVKSHFNNEIGGIITYTGSKPTYDQLMAVPPVLFEQLGNLYQKAFEVVGLSMTSVAGKIPQGLNGSGKALRTHNEIETERFSIAAQNYDDFFLKLADISIKTMEREAKKGNNDFYTTSFNSKFIEKIYWKDIKIERSNYIMKSYPTNFLRTEPSGKLADLQDLLALGIVDKREGATLIDFPDIESITAYKNAPVENIQAVLEKIVDDGEYTPPTPYQALDYGMKLFSNVLLKLEDQGLEGDRLEMIMRWIEDAQLLIKASQPQAQEEMAPAQTAIQGAGAQTIIEPQAQPQNGGF